MRNSFKIFLGLMLSLLMCLSMTAITVMAEDGNVAQIGETKYPSLADAITAATAGDTITLLDDITGDVTVNKSVTIDGAGKTYIGTMTANKGLTVTVENVNFVNGGIAKSTKSSTGTYTVKNCTFDGQNNTYAYAFLFKGANTINIENCSVKDYKYGFLYITAGTSSLSVKNVTVEDCPNYAVYLASGVTTATFENLTVKNGNNGFIIDNSSSRTFTIKDCKMENVGTAIAHTKGTNTITCNVQGYNDFGVTSLSEYVSKNLNVENDTLIVKDAVAKIGNTGYATLADAIAAATAGQTITFVADITGDVTVNKSITIDGAGKTYTGKMTLKANTTIKNVNFDGKDSNGYAVETKGAAKVVIEGCKAENYYGFLQVVSNNDTVTVKNVTVSDVKYGVKVDRSNGVTIENADIAASEAALLNSNYGTKTLTIKDSKLSILGTWTRNDTIKSTYVFEGANSIDEFVIDTALDNFKLADVNATLTAPEEITVTTDVAAHEVVYNNGTYTVAEKKNYVAKIGEQGYESLTAAIAAANAGDTITLLADITEDVTVNKNLIIDGDNFNYTGKMTLNKVNVTIEEVNFVKGTIYKDKNTGTGGNFTIKNCNFDGQALDSYAVNLGRTANVVIEGVTAANYGYGFLQLSHANTSLTVKNVEVSDVNYGFKVDYSGGVTMENVTVTNAEYYGIYDSNYGTKTYTITNCEFSSIKIWERNQTNTTTFKFEGANTVGALDNSNYAKYVLAAEGATLKAPAGAKVTTTVDGHKVLFNVADNVYSVVKKGPAVAKIGDISYETLAEAITAAKDNETVVLQSDLSLENLQTVILDGKYNTYFKVEGKKITIDLNGKTISGDYAGTETMLVGVFSTDNNGHLTLTGNGTVNITASGNKVYSLIANYEEGCSITIENGTWKLDAAIDSLIYSGANDNRECVIVNGGTFALGNVGTGDNGKPWIFNVLGQNRTGITVNGGTFNADVNHQFWANEVFIPKPHALRDNHDGTWTVVDDAVAYVIEKATSTGSTERWVGYATLYDALAAAENNNYTVVMLENVTARYVMVAPGVTLDLNGYNLTAGHVVAFNGSHVIDSSEANTGKLSAKLNTVSLSTTNKQLPVYIDGAYSFYEINIVTNLQFDQENDSATMRFYLAHENDYKELASKLADNGSEDHDLKVMAKITYTTETGEVSQYHKYNSKTVIEMAGFDSCEKYGVYNATLSGISTRNDIKFFAVYLSGTDVEVAVECK